MPDKAASRADYASSGLLPPHHRLQRCRRSHRAHQSQDRDGHEFSRQVDPAAPEDIMRKLSAPTAAPMIGGDPSAYPSSQAQKGGEAEVQDEIERSQFIARAVEPTPPSRDSSSSTWPESATRSQAQTCISPHPQLERRQMIYFESPWRSI